MFRPDGGRATRETPIVEHSEPIGARTTASEGDGARLRAILALAGLVVAALALWLRLTKVASNLSYDTIHFYRFSGVLFGPGHLEYYVWNRNAPDLYGHLPGFPYLLHPFLRLTRALNAPDIYALKILVYASDFGAAAILYLLARRRGLGGAGGLAVATMWLFASWVLEGGALEGHPISVAAFFMLLAILRVRSGWQAGLCWALAVTVRTEFIFPAAAAALHYALWRRDQLLKFSLAGSAVVAAVVLPYALRDFEAFRWGAFQHTQSRGDGLPSLRALLKAFGQPLPDWLGGPPDWSLRVMVPMVVALSALDRDLERALLKVGAVYGLALPVIHARYLLMPLALAMTYCATPRLIWLLIAWYAVDVQSRFLPGEILWTMRIGLTVAIFLAQPLEALSRRRKAAA